MSRVKKLEDEIFHINSELKKAERRSEVKTTGLPWLQAMQLELEHLRKHYINFNCEIVSES